MNKGHRLNLSVDHTFGKASPSKDTMNVDTVIRDSFAKTNTGDEEGDTQLCSTLPGSEKSEEDSRVDKHMDQLTDSTTIKDHNVVAHMHEAPRSGNSVVETCMKEIIVDVATGRAISLPTVEQLEEIMVDVATGRAISLPAVEQLQEITRQHIQHQAAPGSTSSTNQMSCNTRPHQAASGSTSQMTRQHQHNQSAAPSRGATCRQPHRCWWWTSQPRSCRRSSTPTTSR